MLPYTVISFNGVWRFSWKDVFINQLCMAIECTKVGTSILIAVVVLFYLTLGGAPYPLTASTTTRWQKCYTVNGYLSNRAHDNTLYKVSVLQHQAGPYTGNLATEMGGFMTKSTDIMTQYAFCHLSLQSLSNLFSLKHHPQRRCNDSPWLTTTRPSYYDRNSKLVVIKMPSYYDRNSK